MVGGYAHGASAVARRENATDLLGKILRMPQNVRGNGATVQWQYGECPGIQWQCRYSRPAFRECIRA